jgi:lysophospholipase L1-like esterase
LAAKLIEKPQQVLTRRKSSMKLIVSLFLFIIFPFTKDTTFQNKHPFEEEILAFERADKEKSPPRKAILFTGSSSIRLWKDLAESFPDKKVINRGFGGSGLGDLIYYADRIIYPYRPKQVVIYSGENDIAAGKTPEQVFSDFKILFTAIRQKLPNTLIAYISMKPSPSRAAKLEQEKAANQLISDFLKTQKKARYINIFDKMLDASGQPRPELFVLDRLHMNKEGYKIWQQTIMPYLR